MTTLRDRALLLVNGYFSDNGYQALSERNAAFLRASSQPSDGRRTSYEAEQHGDGDGPREMDIHSDNRRPTSLRSSCFR